MKSLGLTADTGLTALAPAIWGSTYLVTTELLPPDRPLLAALLRALPAGVALLAAGRALPRRGWWWRALALGVLNIGAFFWLLFVAAYHLPGGVAALIVAVQPLVVLLLAARLLKDRIQPPQVLACVLGMLGVALLVLTPSAGLDAIGVLAGLAAALCMALGIVLTKRWGRPDGVGLLTFTGWQLTAGGLVLMPVTLLVEGLPDSVTGTQLAGFGYLSIVGALLAYAIWFRGISRLPAVAVSITGFASPLTATVLGYLVLGQSLSAQQILGAAVVVTAIVLAQPQRPGVPADDSGTRQTARPDRIAAGRRSRRKPPPFPSFDAPRGGLVARISRNDRTHSRKGGASVTTASTTAQISRLGGCLTSALDGRVRARPDDVAVLDGARQLTYRELASASGRLADRLRELGVCADDRVGLYVEPSTDLIVGVWAILFAGGAYLPLAPEYPDERLRYMIEDSGARIIVTQDHLAGRLAALAPTGTRVVSVHESSSESRGAATPPTTPRPDHLAYVIYTSGSTGRPKGVMIEHRGVLSQLRWMRSCGLLEREDTVLQKTPVSFDAAQWEILAPAMGVRVVMGSPGMFRDPDALIAAVIRHDVTALQCVPTLLRALVDHEEFQRCTSLRRVFSGGEALSTRLARALHDQLPWASLVNLYGPTECTINATAHLVDPHELAEGTGGVPIGVPVDNTQCYILDENMTPVDIGERGELYIGGVQLARGYLNRPELTRERFIASPFVPTERLYRTGDLAHWSPDGTIQFAGRKDNQVKLRGYRIELDEVALAIEEHAWVRRAATIVTENTRTGSPQLVAFVELDPGQATLMDQGHHGGHHQSKTSRLQVKAQLSNPGIRDADDLRGRARLPLPGRRETAQQRRVVFARKTYRFYEGGKVTRADLEAALAPRPPARTSRDPRALDIAELGEILRWFGQFDSTRRLLPKYAYASPGALYATQLYLETGGVAGLPAGLYYHHPVDHALVRISPAEADAEGRLRVHFLGRRSAIEPVYRTNIEEVLEFEAGHMVGVFEEVLAEHGLVIRPLEHRPAVRDRLDVAAEDHYLGTFRIGPADGQPDPDPTEILVQAHPGRVANLPAGQYRYVEDRLELLCDDLLLSRHMIAINQPVYRRAAFGITAISRAEQRWLEYLCLGTKLHHLQRNDLGLGLMSSGYSSKSGHPLPAARLVDELGAAHGIRPGACYFFLGGKVSDTQLRSEGMHEDTVHMRGPAEIITEELASVLPDYMVPNRVHVLDELPLTANGKVDTTALATEHTDPTGVDTPYVAPHTPHEQWLAEAWGQALNYDRVSAADDFFASGGNSLIAVSLVNAINKRWRTRLPLQVIFEHPRLAELAARIGDAPDASSSRLIPLHDTGVGRPVYCWPGLGGYPMNLRLLGARVGLGHPFHGVQAFGINAGEQPHPTVTAMAAADVAEIRRVQPEGPYALWGYSFGARVAFEAAWQLEQSGAPVEHLMLICPGNPKIGRAPGRRRSRQANYRDPAFITILYSVFTGTITGAELHRCLAQTRDEHTFTAFIHQAIPHLDVPLIRRITRIVAQTYEFEYTFHELARRRVNAPATLIKAAGDDYSFIEGSSGYAAEPPTIIELDTDHYGVLAERGVTELVSAIRGRLIP